jgi:N-acetylneuraminic acid mutarotase
MYDPVADSWQQMAAMPTARYSHASAVVDGKIYVSGGFTTLVETSDAFEAGLDNTGTPGYEKYLV